MLLEVVIMCGTFCQDEVCAGLLVQAGLPHLLIDCLKGESVLYMYIYIACSIVWMDIASYT